MSEKQTRENVHNAIDILKKIEEELISSIKLEKGQLWESEGKGRYLIVNIENEKVSFIFHNSTCFNLFIESLDEFKRRRTFCLIETIDVSFMDKLNPKTKE